jgi:hypothetical protein
MLARVTAEQEFLESVFDARSATEMEAENSRVVGSGCGEALCFIQGTNARRILCSYECADESAAHCPLNHPISPQYDSK